MKMNKLRMPLLLIVASCLVLITSCSKKPEDFIGVHTFYKGTSYVVIDSTTNISKGYFKKYKEIQTVRHLPMKIDIFKNGEQVSGTISFETIQQEMKGYYFNTPILVKKDLTNIHLIGDTLIGEIKYENPYIGEQTLQFRLIKNDDEILMVENRAVKDSITEGCNKLVKFINGNQVIYISSKENQLNLVKESNQCADEKALKNLSDYPSEKIPYFKELLSKY
jgi:hypothetical protein